VFRLFIHRHDERSDIHPTEADDNWSNNNNLICCPGE